MVRRAIGVVLLGVGLVLSGGCESDTDLRGSIVLAEPVGIAVPGSVTSIGYVDGWVLVTSFEEVTDPPAEWGDFVTETFVTWIAPDDTVGEPLSLGWATENVDWPRWIAWEGGLWASITATLETSATPPLERHFFRIWGLSPTAGVTCNAEPDLGIAHSTEFPTAAFFNGFGGFHPATSTPDGPVFGLSAIPSRCGGPFVNYFRALIVRGCATTPEWIDWGPAPCDRAVTSAANGFTLTSRGAELGVLFRTRIDGTRPGDVRWSHFTSDRGATPSLLVSNTTPSITRAIPESVVLDHRVLWIDPRVEGLTGECACVRRMSWDGSDLHDAPWQLPCNHGPYTAPVTDLIRLGDQALLASIEATAEGVPARAMLVALTADGRRASELVDLTRARVSTLAVATEGLNGASVYTGPEGVVLTRFVWREGLR